MGVGGTGWKDAAIAIAVAAALLAAALAGPRPGTDLDSLGYGLLIAGGLSLVAHRRASVAVLVLSGLSVLGYRLLGFDVPALAYLVAVYAAVRAGHLMVSVAVSLA